jgi:predicted porin
MKPFVLAPAVFALFSGAALAQSSSGFGATVFGVLDADLRSVHNGSAGVQKQLSSDGLSSSRLGFRGAEDLGDGLKAIFWLEATIAPDTGTTNATRFWNRRSTVALSDPRFGEVRLGRDYTPLFTAYAVYDPFGTNGLGEIVSNTPGIGVVSALGSGAATLTRSDNLVSYFLPAKLGGVYGQLSIAPSEGVTGGKFYSGRLGWAGGPIDVSAGYAQTTVALNDKFKQAQVGVAYDFGVAKVSGQYIQATYDSVAGGDRKQKVWQLGVSVPMVGGQVRADFIHGDMTGGAVNSGFGDADDANQITAGFLYDVSKRTAIYANVSTLRNKGASKLVVAAANNGMLGGEKSKGYDVGLRHAF